MRCMRKRHLRFHCLDGLQPPTNNHAQRSTRYTYISPQLPRAGERLDAHERLRLETTVKPSPPPTHDKAASRPTVRGERSLLPAPSSPNAPYLLRTMRSEPQFPGRKPTAVRTQAFLVTQVRNSAESRPSKLTTIFAFAFLPTSRPSHHTPSVLCIAFQRSGPMDRNTAWHR